MTKPLQASSFSVVCFTQSLGELMSSCTSDFFFQGTCNELFNDVAQSTCTVLLVLFFMAAVNIDKAKYSKWCSGGGQSVNFPLAQKP